MKNIRLPLLLCAAALAGKSQPYGETYYPHAGSYFSSGSLTSLHTNGFIMAGYEPTLPATLVNFNVDKTGPGGAFSPASAIPFSYSYKVSADANCSANPPQINNCNPISIIETNAYGSGGAWYALTGSFNSGVFFATLNSSGSVASVQGFNFPVANSYTRPSKIVESTSTSGEFFICGGYNTTSADVVYVIKITASGSVSSRMYKSSIGNLLPNDIVFSPYGNELVIVGQASNGTGGDRGFMMRINASSLNIVQSNLYGQTNAGNTDYFNSIAVATSPNPQKGFVIGGYTDQNLPSGGGDVWMLKVNTVGNILWNTVLLPTSDPAAINVVDVMERKSPMYGYTYYGAVTSTVGMMVVKLDDNGSPFTSTLSIDNVNEFVYDNVSAPSQPVNLSYLDNGGSSDIGIHVYGDVDNTTGGNHYFVEAAFNGYSEGSCNSFQTNMGNPSTGPGNNATFTVNINGGLQSCSSFNITGTSITTSPNSQCSSTTLPAGGSNNKTTGIASQQAAENSFAVYPNPVSSKVQIKFTASENTPVRIELYDYLGRFIHNIPVANTGGSQTVELDLSGLNIESGIYIINANINGQSSKQKIVYTKE